MSRIGKNPIPVPAGVEVTTSSDRVVVSGPRGQLARSLPDAVSVVQEESRLVVTRRNDERRSRALHGLTRSLVANMVTGVTTGFTRELDIVGVGYRVTSSSPTRLDLALGFSHPVVVEAPDGINFEVPAPTKIVVKGNDKEQVGQVAANIRRLRKPEPYKGKGIRYADEVVVRKAGKAGK
jgi:large subunit ribosomal protein L6